jgi:hypothetical protein
MAPAELGLSVDAVETAKRAFSVGREQQLTEAIHEAATSLRDGVEIEPVVNLDLPAARRKLEALARFTDSAPQNARLEILGGRIVTSPSHATLALMAADPAALLLRYSFVPLILNPRRPAVPDVQAAAAPGRGTARRARFPQGL